MGSDGAAELVALRSLGAFTLVQDCGSSVVYGMAEVAVRLDACVRTAPPEEIALALSGLSLPRTSP
jgi:chemotaxis response regulator CheB